MFLTVVSGLGSSVGIATDYGLVGPGIESRWGEIFRACPDRLWSLPSLLYNGYRLFPGVKCGRSVLLATHPFLELYLYPPSGSQRASKLVTLPLLLLLTRKFQPSITQFTAVLVFASNSNITCNSWILVFYSLVLQTNSGLGRIPFKSLDHTQ
jgi:hypothetical protein